jgi:hypothetical protein
VKELTDEKVECCGTEVFQRPVKLYGLAALLTLHGGRWVWRTMKTEIRSLVEGQGVVREEEGSRNRVLGQLKLPGIKV